MDQILIGWWETNISGLDVELNEFTSVGCTWFKLGTHIISNSQCYKNKPNCITSLFFACNKRCNMTLKNGLLMSLGLPHYSQNPTFQQTFRTTTIVLVQFPTYPASTFSPSHPWLAPLAPRILCVSMACLAKRSFRRSSWCVGTWMYMDHLYLV